MNQFPRLNGLPGLSRDSEGRLTFTLTSEEQQEIDSTLAIAREDNVAIRSDCAEAIEKAMMANALVRYAKAEIELAETCEPDQREDALRKALASIVKAGSLHHLPIYTFDLGCMFQLLGDDDTAADCFHQFLESTERFRPSDVDAALLKQRDIALAIRTATKKLELASKNPSR